jgi:hypothetical protein
MLLFLVDSRKIQAADVLDFQEKPSLVVVLTEGDETCGGSPCDVGTELHAAAERLTVHVIGLRVKGLSWRIADVCWIQRLLCGK